MPLTNVQIDALASGTVAPEHRTPTGIPYLSVVATARNDNHGGDLLARMQVFVNGLAEQADRFALPVELVLVEWNPPADRPPLAEALEWPACRWCSFRIVEVPHELHARLEHADRLPLFQMIAKNAGIRRARGEFVLATNVDVLFPDALMRWLAGRDLRRDRVYRVDRHDVAIAPDPTLSTDETLRLADRNQIRICARMGTHDLVTGAFYRIYDDPRLPLWAHRVLHIWRGLSRRAHSLAHRIRRLARAGWSRLAGALALLARGGHPNVHVAAPAVPLNPLLVLGGLLHLARSEWRALRTAWAAEAARVRLHTNASGDFTLLSREGWDATRAYPELELFSMHLDGLFLYQAHHAGFREEFVPRPIFHIEHSHGFKPAPSEVKSLNTRLERAAIPQVTNEQFLRWITTMHETKAPIAFNGGDWGLAGETLTEKTPARALEQATA